MMSAVTRDEAQVRLWRDPCQLPYHERQLLSPYRSTLHLLEFLRSLRCGEGDALDVGCGAGANILHLGRCLPGLRWTGVDLAGDLLFDVGRPHLAAAGIEADLRVGDLYELEHVVGDRRFDLVLSIQTLSWLPDWKRALDRMLAVTRGWLVISSLFTQFDVDVRLEAADHTVQGHLAPYVISVFALDRFRAYCRARGARRVVAREFISDVDLPVPASRGLGTYTRRLASGERLQFTGPVHLPWWFVGIRMADS